MGFLGLFFDFPGLPGASGVSGFESESLIREDRRWQDV